MSTRFLFSAACAILFLTGCESAKRAANLIETLSPPLAANNVPLSLASVSPARSGPGARITLSGTGFQTGATVQIGGMNAQVDSLTSTSIVVRVPDLPEGNTDIRVINPDLAEAQLPSSALHVSWVTQIATSSTHSCTVVNQEIQCWGQNTHGQLGNGVPFASDPNPNPAVFVPLPVKVLGINGGVTGIALGMSHTCAIVNGLVKCWGRASSGQLGNDPVGNDNFPPSTPVTVLGLANVTSIAAAMSTTCAVANGGVYCWGGGSLLGNGGDSGNESARVPVALTALSSGVQKIVSGGGMSFWFCALVSGAVWCWGQNGMLGDGSIDQTLMTPFEVPGVMESFVPVPVTGLQAGVTDLWLGGNNACAKVGAQVKCWGSGGFHMLQNGSTDDVYIARTATGLPSLPNALAFGGVHGCGVFSGAAKCWGANVEGSLGNGSPPASISSVPVDVTGLSSGVQAIQSSYNHVCAIKNGGLYCWGLGSNSGLGNGSLGTAFTPVVPLLQW